jgi:transcription-repair coupling factor (superfamily II helicase)
MRADLPGIISPLIEDKSFQAILKKISEGQKQISISGLVDPARSFFVALAFLLTGRRIAYVVLGDGEVESQFKNLSSLVTFLGGEVERVVKFPSLDADPYSMISPHLQSVSERASALGKILKGEAGITVLSLRSLINVLLPPREFSSYFFPLKKDQKLSMDEFMTRLAESGYRAVDIVSSTGEYSRKGGIIDLFQPGDGHPHRIEFSGDEIESLRTYDITTQLSVEKIKKIIIRPASEIPLNSRTLDQLIRFLRKKRGEKDPKTREILEKIQEERYYPGVEGCGKIMLTDHATIFQYLKDHLTILDESMKAEEEAISIYAELEESFKEGRSPVFPEPSGLFVRIKDILSWLKSFHLSVSDLEIDAGRKERSFAIHSRSSRNYAGRVSHFIADLKKEKPERSKIVVMMNSSGSKDRIKEIFQEHSLSFSEDFTEDFPDRFLYVTECKILNGFELPDVKITFYSESEVFGQEKPRIERISAHKSFASDFRDLKIGDYVVHVDHGIGKYAGIVKPGGSAGNRDFMLILYVGGDRLYLPVERLDLVQRYSGIEGKRVILDKLGGISWQRAKKKAKKSIENLAKDLLQLYAEREAIKGYSHLPDTEWQEEFERAFAFEETPDQIRSIEEIKKDLELDKPMDRLLCGDVGYGKTEVAMRAAFKAVMDSRQVALLAPTTILAFQHYNTFRRRFSPFPIEIEMLSRFKKLSQQKEIVKKIKEGKIDIVIGTHRLLSKDVSFKKLGILIVDEEQRFGVLHKEKLKMMAKGIDVLSMTATPIPRTLQMSMAGVRAMSVIETPPANRMSIQTHMAPFKKGFIRSAIKKELRRAGQVYFVHNRVDSLPSMAKKVKELCPEAKVAMVHGRMSEKTLEKTMLEFISGKYDVLVSTVIIENGLDIPRVNTIIINRADKFGLAQLYQLRGRVGRSDVKAYALLLIPSLRTLTATARKRLRALQEFTELGSGFRLAAKDLEIRGAGELLGKKQHGFIATLGFELYIKMLERAVRELKGEVVMEPIPVKINLGIDSRIPESFIPAENLRLAFYKRVASAETEGELEETRREVMDRYGHLPPQGKNLFKLAHLKILASRIDLRAMDYSDGKLKLKFGEASPISAERIVDFLCENRGSSLTPSGMLVIPQLKDLDRLNWAESIIGKLL